MKKWNEKWTTPVRVLLAGAGIAAAAILVPMVVSALAPSAGQVIGNQAAATYKDASGISQETKSNQVSTTVAQIGGITLTNQFTKSAAAGNIVYFPHDLINTGNGTDSFVIQAVDPTTFGTFSKVAIYADPYSTGKGAGAPLCASDSTGAPAMSGVPSCTTGFVQSVAGNQGVVHLIAAYTIPSTATTPITPFNTATVTATPGTLTGSALPIVPSSVPYPTPAAQSRTDTIHLTTLAAFTSTKAIEAPGVLAPGNGAWPAVLTGGKGSKDGTSCPTTWATMSTSADCTYTVYTISYSNVGGVPGSYSMSDTIPSGMTYVTGSAVWSGASGTALKEDGTATAGVSPNTISSTFAAGKFSATVSNVVNGHNGTISFVVLVKSTAAAGSTTTTNTALFSTTTCDAACVIATPPLTPTNPSDFPVTPTYRVIAANVSTATTFDVVAGTPLKSGVDIVDVTSAFLGTKVPFTTTTPTSNFVINKGNVNDTFNLSIDAGNYPTGTTFAFYKADGATPLIDTNGYGMVDTGSLAPDASVEIRVVASLPSTATLLTVPYDALMTATSAGAKTLNLTVKDAVWERVDTIKSAQVDLTNSTGGNLVYPNGSGSTSTPCTAGSNCDLGKGPSPQPTDTESTTPGTPAKFPIFVTNQDTTSTSAIYDLTAKVPNGWTVKFVASTDTCAAGPFITQVTVNSSTGANQTEVFACITPPTNTSTGMNPVEITATKNGAPTVTDTITDAVNVTAWARDAWHARGHQERGLKQ